MEHEKLMEELQRLRKIERNFNKLLREKEIELEEKKRQEIEEIKKRYQERMDDLGELIANIAEKTFKKARLFLK